MPYAPRGTRQRRPAGPGPSGAATDRQTIRVRRAVAAGAGLLVLILLVFGIKGCLNARKDRAFRDYAADVRALMRESDGLSNKLFDVLSKPGNSDSLDIQMQISAQATDGEQLVERAKDTDHPDELNDAEHWIVTTLGFRRDALKRIAEKIPAALADKGRRPAIVSIAGQMQAFLASDVIYSQRALPQLEQKFQDRDINERFPLSKSLTDLSWLEPDTVEARLGKIGNVQKQATPGIHGTGLQGVTAKPSGTALTESGVNRIALTAGLSFDVDVQNQGESEESDVGVTISITDGKRIEVDQAISRIAAGDTQAVSIPISQKPTTGAVNKLTVEVAPVPGEKVRDNNEATYQVVFTGSP